MKPVFLRILSLLSLIILPCLAFAQTFGNEWINYSQQYYKIPVTQKGIYRVTPGELQAAGFPVNSVDPRRIQLFRRGFEQAIFISGEADAVLNPNDYLEFYGEGNDGSQDSLLYQPSSAQPHKYYSLYSDTAVYFLTWRLDNGLGKRMEAFSEVNTGGIPAETFHWEENLLVNTDQYAAGQTHDKNFDLDARMSHYDYGEGWTGANIEKFNSLDYTLPGIQSLVNAGIKPRLEVLLVGINSKRHLTELFVGTSSSSLRSLGTTQWQYCNNQLFSVTIEPTDLGSQSVVRARSNGLNDSNRDAIAVSYVRLLYPQAMDAANRPQKLFRLQPKATGKSYVEISNPASNTALYDITDRYAIKRIGTGTTGGKLTAIVPNTTVQRMLLANAGFLPVPGMRRIGFRNIDPQAHNFFIISHQSLMKPAGGFPDAVRAYAGYRASAVGGGFDTLVLDADLLYNQFGYGEFSPLSIRRFAQLMTQFGRAEQYLFLIGKSYYPQDMRKDPARYTKDLVPTGGYPGSDIVLTAGIKGIPYVPGIPTGRINAIKPENVINYLNKVKEHEATPQNALWRKNMVHLSGGRYQNELRAFKLFVDDFKRVAEGQFFGAKVATLSKKTDNTVELINIADQVNKGLSMITFFGHSGPDITDIEIGYVSDPVQGYRNKGKYPMILVNGCEAGDIFANRYTFGEDWILTPDKGAILFLADSRLGYPLPLKRYSDNFYATAFADSLFVSKPVGVIQQEVIRRFTAGVTDNFLELSHAEQFTLQGDPAIRLLNTDKPDYYTANGQLFLKSFDNSKITAITDSFQMGIITSNFGKADRREIPVTVRRTTGDGLIEQYDTLLYAPVYYQDTLFFTIRTQNINAGGSNKFEVFLDATGSIAELDENNNYGVLEYFMPAVGAVPLFPKEYSIVSEQPVTFIAQATSVATENRQFVFELDTVYTFDSPAKRSAIVTAGFLPAWQTDLLSRETAHDSTVYYWRVRFADLPDDANNTWGESSFIYITNSPEGWSQSRFPQFSKSNPQQVRRNVATETWEFPEVSTSLAISVYGRENQPDAYTKNELQINGSPTVFGGRCGDNTLSGVAFNRSTLRAYAALPFNTCGRAPQALVSNYLDNNYIQNGGLSAYLDAVPTGDYVLLFTNGSVNFDLWSGVMKDELTKIGADPAKVAQLQNGHPYIILGKKGDFPGSAIEIFADYSSGVEPIKQAIALQHVLNGRFNEGTITSSLIGPASDWGTLFRTVLNSELNSSDQWQLDLIGTTLQGAETTVLTNVPKDTFLLDNINASQYPYLKLRLRIKDTTNLTPPQLNKWQVIYTGVPEGVINPGLVKAETYKIPDKSEGETFSVDFAFQNISKRNFTDSLTVQYSVSNTDTRKKTAQTFKIKALAAGDTVRFSVPVQTMGFAGANVLQVYVNPRLLPEQNYSNNLYEVLFQVRPDNVHPVLDVAFDGVKIMDGDIVSPSPLITVRLKDENKVLLKQDTTGMELYLKRPCQNCQFERVILNQADVRVTAAQTENNDFRIEYHPKNLPDGVYTLRVQGSDATGNLSSTQESPYRISFEVINQSSITHFYPYPNPFSSSTRFVFTLTGNEIPDQLKIQVMTVTGKVVREITQDELGPIHVGNNISRFAWDGTDEFGDKLANGVYLYRVVMKQQGQTIEHRQTAGDKAFKKDFGKLYILR